MIANALQEFSRGEPHQTLVLQGEAGIGKSRLFEDLVRQAETLNVKMFSGERGCASRRIQSLSCLASIFNKIFDIEEFVCEDVNITEETEAAIQNNVLEKLTEIDPDLARYAPLVDVFCRSRSRIMN